MGEENLYLTPQTDGPDQSQDPGQDSMVRADILGIQTVALPQGGSHLIIISNPIHQSTSDGSINIYMTPGRNINQIKSRT